MLNMHSCITDTVQSEQFTASLNNMLKKINSWTYVQVCLAVSAFEYSGLLRCDTLNEWVIPAFGRIIVLSGSPRTVVANHSLNNTASHFRWLESSAALSVRTWSLTDLPILYGSQVPVCHLAAVCCFNWMVNFLHTYLYQHG